MESSLAYQVPLLPLPERQAGTISVKCGQLLNASEVETIDSLLRFNPQERATVEEAKF